MKLFISAPSEQTFFKECVEEIAKERLDTRGYFLKRDEIENKVIASDFPFAFFQESATLSEIEGLRLDVLDAKTLMLIIISALKSYVDNDPENPKAEALHVHYLRLKQELSSVIPFESGDGYLEYLGSKNVRAELLDARVSGSVCLRCGSHDIKSKGKEWQCKVCGKRFRKH
jgi:hypothetical protein